jgi:hypothetical protein
MNYGSDKCNGVFFSPKETRNGSRRELKRKPKHSSTLYDFPVVRAARSWRSGRLPLPAVWA